MNVRAIKNESGFSLVELMVVVAIIGILASLAIPSVGKYMAKARQSEAKTQLSSYYTAEKAFYAEYTAYHSGFGAVGYSPEGKLRYTIGMAANAANDANTINGFDPAKLTAQGKLSDTLNYCGMMPASNIIDPLKGCALLNGADNTNPAALTPLATGVGAGATFLAGANAKVYKAQNDVWTINESKELLNPTPGIQ